MLFTKYMFPGYCKIEIELNIVNVSNDHTIYQIVDIFKL